MAFLDNATSHSAIDLMRSSAAENHVMSMSPQSLAQGVWEYMQDDRVFEGNPYVESIKSNMNVVGTICLSYVMLVVWGQKLMKDRKAMDLKTATIGWNCFLAIFSFICFFKFTRETIDVWTSPTSRGVICEPPPRDGQHALWQLLFIASKVWEFGDTGLLILRKRPVIFLHWYHHTTVLALSCFIGGHNSPLRRVFANVNSGVHAIMYTYYAFASAGVRAPKAISMTITSMQLLQMGVGVYVCLESLRSCNFRENSSAHFSLIIYFSYLVLFANFFYNAYYRRKAKST